MQAAGGVIMRRRPSKSLQGAVALLIAALGSLGGGIRADAGLPGEATCPPKVPPPAAQARIFAQQTDWLAQYRKSVAGRTAAGPSAPSFGGHLLTADSNRATALLQPDAMRWVELSLDRFQEMGMTGVTLNIGYPMLLPEFPDSARYLAFYRDVAKAVRKRRMSLAVEQTVLYARTPFSPFDFRYKDQTVASYTRGQARMAQILIDELAPDYLTVMHEPDTVAGLTGLKAFLDPAVATSYVNTVLSGLRRGHTLVGAGSGSWSDPAFAQSFLEHTSIDYVDAHLYWINPPSIANLYAMVDAAKAHGKPVILTEAGLYKSVGDGAEGGTYNVDAVAAVYRRDVFSFWQPLDREFLDITGRFARKEDVKFLSVYWTNMFFAYLDWTPQIDRLSYSQLNANLAGRMTALAWQADRFTCSARAYQNVIEGGDR
jgi:hypothetical protein